MIILGLESSCDDTAAALLTERKILSSIVASQEDTHHPYGGVVPELASREHTENICFVVERTLCEAGIDFPEIDAIAVTQGPGLVGALLVGLCYAKGLAFSLEVPLVGVNHLQGHMASIFFDHPQAEYPALSLVVSGGHTSLFYMQSESKFEEIARTLDDAAGEALDHLAVEGNPEAIRFSLPKISSGELAFSFSGLKSAAARVFLEAGWRPLPSNSGVDVSAIPEEILDFIASYQKAVVDQILDRLKKALEGRDVASIHISGGVACNSELRCRSQKLFKEMGVPVYFPNTSLTTDNAAMIALAGARRIETSQKDSWDLKVNPNLPLYR
jgi:N6-L-threonylcarbamoyladenine synthase